MDSIPHCEPLTYLFRQVGKKGASWWSARSTGAHNTSENTQPHPRFFTCPQLAMKSTFAKDDSYVAQCLEVVMVLIVDFGARAGDEGEATLCGAANRAVCGDGGADKATLRTTCSIVQLRSRWTPWKQGDGCGQTVCVSVATPWSRWLERAEEKVKHEWWPWGVMSWKEEYIYLIQGFWKTRNWGLLGIDRDTRRDLCERASDFQLSVKVKQTQCSDTHLMGPIRELSVRDGWMQHLC